MLWKRYTMEITRRITKKPNPSFLSASVAHGFQGVCILSHIHSFLSVWIRINRVHLTSWIEYVRDTTWRTPHKDVFVAVLVAVALACGGVGFCIQL